MRNPFNPPPAPPAYGQGKVIPETKVSPFSRLLFSWLDPLLSVGFSRPLQADDFWSLPDNRLTGHMTERVEQEFYSECPPEERPTFPFNPGHASPKDDPGGNVTRNTSRSSQKKPADEKTAEAEGTQTDLEKNAAQPQGTAATIPKSEPSILKALHAVFWRQFWTAGVLKLFADTLNTTTPLVNQVLLSWLTSSFVYYHATEEERAAQGLHAPQGVGYGIGLAFAVFFMQEISGVMTTQYQMIAMTNGLYVRSSIIGAVFRKSLRLSGRARSEHSVGQITTMISADSAKFDLNCVIVHNVWVAPIQIAIGIGLLIRNLGVSALVGLGVLIFSFPLQGVLAGTMFKQRTKGVALTDQRARLTSEVLSGIRLIKYYAWEQFYAQQVDTVREREIQTMVPWAAAQATLIGFMAVVPIVGTVLSIITYALTGHSLNVAIIFSSVQFFDIIRMPLTLLPIVLASAMDALVAIRRVSAFLRAEELAVPYTINPASDYALDVDGDFTWEEVRKDMNAQAKNEQDKDKDKAAESTLPTTAPPEEQEKEKAPEEKPFELKNLRLKVPKGAFVAIVGRVGSGKSSVLQALIGEMRKSRGTCTFSSTTAYVPQAAWIMNATLRQNIIFGQEEDEEKLRQVIKACCLEPDLEMLPNGADTEIGEKGINLSGGQKARVSLARAAYSGADIVLMDDSLSAVDSYVGKRLLDGCLLHGPLEGKTRVLVTHALHVLDKTDYIYVMDEGAIVEQGTYNELLQNGHMFARLIEEYGSQEKQEEQEAAGDDAQKPVVDKEDAKTVVPEVPQSAKDPQALMQEEERLTGAVSWSVYAKYFHFAGGIFGFLLLVLFVVLAQGAQVGNTLFLGFWTSSSIPGFNQGDYMGTYAALGVGAGIFSCALSFTVSKLSLMAGLRMFKAALIAVVRSPVSFFDTTPLGRIISRLSKDQDTVDAELAIIATNLLIAGSSIVGTAGLVFYTFPYLGIIFAPMIVLYYAASLYYRRNSVEMKRLDSLLRSNLFASYSETLTGLSTVRAYRSQYRFIAKSEAGLDQENRAYYMTIAIQCWLAVRLDILGNLLILGIGLFAAGFRRSVDPSKIGVVMSYTLSITQMFSTLVTMYAHNEQNFNAVERILHYTELPSEGAATTPNDPPPSWPESGAVEFKDVEMVYRQGLPLVLKGVSFAVKPGEKVGIVGRTGAGKSSLLQALFRIINIQKGVIEIDGRNIADIGLDTLRGRLALVPQDSLLFQGTLRDNLDPQHSRTDAEIIDALKRAWLLPKDGPVDPAVEAKFSLDSAVSDEGSNYSAGEKQLLALCRALVKNSRIIVLDEATSNVDVETDSKVQRTIQTEFASSTLLCVAHRLNTIVYYDRILVMDAGKVAEFDTPLNLYDKEDSIFRSLCNEANLSRQDIVKIRATVQEQPSVPA
ncbi:multidrug resistance-associated ABC transporter [Lentinus tigrinus ALCF2SS1-7]|uniref:Multidrug resistance-associated ABC transporter n=1 Tax=Lentinus tigrinus ALCF2SS1-6 TaxID=1328759 RepID=A0A5C2RYI5_9APHY|nr:multidrug resistance-associated ABC transporter [Lentinus tigrinus ALCF2SS1-6]RPD73996.1 multidrug resistance-associated ABC transporter [Lentinus tigrinus ALCF2SS1-7]